MTDESAQAIFLGYMILLGVATIWDGRESWRLKQIERKLLVSLFAISAACALTNLMVWSLVMFTDIPRDHGWLFQIWFPATSYLRCAWPATLLSALFCSTIRGSGLFYATVAIGFVGMFIYARPVAY